MAFYEATTQWHTGEEEMHKLLRVPHQDNPTQPYLTPHAANILVRSPLIALGTLDSEGRPWTTLWGGEAGFSQPVAQSIIGMKTTVNRELDPVLKMLLGDIADGEVYQEKGVGKMVGALAIDLETRRRVKLYGRMVAGALAATEEGLGQVQLVVKIEQSLGNCPKYLNKKHIVAHLPNPKLVASDLPLPRSAIDLIEKADLFFISSSNHESDMDTNHRGGPPGFVRILSNNEDGLTLVYPEYSGNRLYQTLGNLKTTARAGLVFPDFDTSDVLYITGKTEILAGKAATDLIAHTNLAVKIKVEAARFVSDALAFRGQEGEFSPYNPPLRYLSSETRNAIAGDDKRIFAKLVDKTIITPTVGRFRFRIADPAKASKWMPGQYVALSFAEELDIGYSHMRDDDPKSLNDDFLRTFTVSSRQGEPSPDQFEITIRKVGPVTDLLFRHNVRSGLEVPLQGFGGEFFIKQDNQKIAFIAGGVGITPLLAQAEDLDLEQVQLYWTIRGDDVPLAIDIFERIPGLAKATKLFVTGKVNEESEAWQKLSTSGASIEKRRITKDDIAEDTASRWYLCTGAPLRKTLLEWLDDAIETDKDGKPTITTNLATAILPEAAVPLSRILNHPNIISLVDIIHKSVEEGDTKNLGKYSDITVWEDMDAGCLSYLLPPVNNYPAFHDEKSWFNLAAQNFQRFSLPESLCWHVLKSISRALLWLHFGVKETIGVPGEFLPHDDDWMPILIMDVSPSQIWFKRPMQGETYGECKLGGFQWARVTGMIGGRMALAARMEDAPRRKQYYWAPEIYKNTNSWSRPSEIWALGATIYTMMTGIPPPRFYEYNWQISRMNDKGFSQGIREIIGAMLQPHPADRPTALDLVNKVDVEWRRWRSETTEGRRFVDVNDKVAFKSLLGPGAGQMLPSM
ncbi:hypothetical protein EG329_011338 [Mollisiaceae sp. DMI_Dod_QoI]|nr:hypothetical protein EG329_011338 [Helotiales sp. DMI_Dod_QoI]